MTYTTEWSITSLRRETSDGYVLKALVRITATDTEDPTHQAIVGGDCSFKRPEGNMIPYEDLTESQVLEWVKAQWAVEKVPGMSFTVLELKENSLEQFMNLPRMEDGLPWTTMDEYGNYNVGVGTT